MLIKKIIFFIFLTSLCFAQSKSEIEKFINYSCKFILERAHSNSTLESHYLTVLDSDDSNFDKKAILVIHYKGLIKKHNLKCYIYFDKGPKKFVWGKDTNTFPINTKDDSMLEELKEIYSIWLKENEK